MNDIYDAYNLGYLPIDTLINFNISTSNVSIFQFKNQIKCFIIFIFCCFPAKKSHRIKNESESIFNQLFIYTHFLMNEVLATMWKWYWYMSSCLVCLLYSKEEPGLGRESGLVYNKQQSSNKVCWYERDAKHPLYISQDISSDYVLLLRAIAFQF